MAQKEQPEYPTEAQMKEMWAALETGNDKEILRVLQTRRLEREARENPTQIPPTDGD